MNVPKKTKREIRLMTLGVIVNWLANECHLDTDCEQEHRYMKWAMDEQSRIGEFIKLEMMKLRLSNPPTKSAPDGGQP